LVSRRIIHQSGVFQIPFIQSLFRVLGQYLVMPGCCLSDYSGSDVNPLAYAER